MTDLFLIPIFFPSSSSDIDGPTNLVTTEVTEDTATVSWDRVQAEIDGYMLSYTSSEGSSGEIPVGRDSTSYRLVGLRPGVLYTVYIWAYKGDRVSRKSSTEAETGKLPSGPRFITGGIYVILIFCVRLQQLKSLTDYFYINRQMLLFDIPQRLDMTEILRSLSLEHTRRCVM